MKVSTYTELDDVIKVLDRFVVEKTTIQNSSWDEEGPEPNVGLSIRYSDDQTDTSYYDVSSSPKFDFQVGKDKQFISFHIGSRDIYLSGISSIRVEEVSYNNEDYIREIIFNFTDHNMSIYVIQIYFLDYE